MVQSRVRCACVSVWTQMFVSFSFVYFHSQFSSILEIGSFAKSGWVMGSLIADICQMPIEVLIIFFVLSSSSAGSLPPSPADSGVSDVDSSSSGGQTCSDELKARLGLPSHCPPQNHVPPGPFLNPNYYHNSPPLRNIWNNRNVTCKYHIPPHSSAPVSAQNDCISHSKWKRARNDKNDKRVHKLHQTAAINFI